MPVLCFNEAPQAVAAAHGASFGNGVADVGTVKAGNKALCIIEVEFIDDFMSGAIIGSGGECDARHIGKCLTENFKLAVFGAKVMPPL